MYLTDEETDLDTCLMLTYSIKFNPIEPSYHSMIWLTSNSSSSFAGSRIFGLRCGCGFIRTRQCPWDMDVHEEVDMVMLLVGLGITSSPSNCWWKGCVVAHVELWIASADFFLLSIF